MTIEEHLLIVGASVRAAAFSAVRAGFRPWCADLFADADLAACCPTIRLRGRYPNAFADLFPLAPPGPWLYTGGLENHPGLVRRLAEQRRLWGNDDHVLVLARDPALLASSARDAGLPAPALAEKPGAGRWLVKPRGGAGGIGIHRYEGSLPRGCYLQEFVPGLSFSAVYVGLAGSCQLLGVTRQLVGEPFVHAPTFRYCGSIGPVKLDDASEKKIKDLGNILVLRAGLHGLFGVDGIWNEGGFWPVELNPRYTASIEVLEYATGIRTLALQRHAFEGGTLPSFDRRERPVIVGKAILYTRADVCIPEQVPVAGSSETIPAFADLPYPGDSIEAGRPVLSLFATGQDIEDCLHALHDRAAGVEAWLYAGG